MNRLLWIGAALVVLGLGYSLLRSPTVTPRVGLPSVLADEPDVYVERGRITRYRDSGALEYLATAAIIRQFDAEGITRLVEPDVELHSAAQAPTATAAVVETAGSVPPPGLETTAPWRIRSRVGRFEIVAASATQNGSRETLFLEQDVVLEQNRPDGGQTRLDTATLEVHPATQYARTDTPVIITTDNGSVSAAGFEGFLSRDWMKLTAGPTQRVRAVIPPIKP